MNALVSSEQVRFKQTFETVCTDGRVPDEIQEASWGYLAAAGADGGYFAVRRQLDVSVQLQKTACQRIQLQLMCYQWLYEDVLTSAGHQQSSGPRASLMTDLKKVLLPN